MENLGKQEQRVLEYMKKNNTINPLQSWVDCGVYRLSAVIFNLKKKGYEIESNRSVAMNRFDEEVKFAEYLLT
tara:strand:+ start:407 stop:625 length:219 start_codon:yes stop_codon:yes gene_type:complete